MCVCVAHVGALTFNGAAEMSPQRRCAATQQRCCTAASHCSGATERNGDFARRRVLARAGCGCRVVLAKLALAQRELPRPSAERARRRVPSASSRGNVLHCGRARLRVAPRQVGAAPRWRRGSVCRGASRATTRRGGVGTGTRAVCVCNIDALYDVGLREHIDAAHDIAQAWGVCAAETSHGTLSAAVC